MLKAEWIPYMKAYRVYDSKQPNNTICYEDDEAELTKRNIPIVDSDTMHHENFSDL